MLVVNYWFLRVLYMGSYDRVAEAIYVSGHPACDRFVAMYNSMKLRKNWLRHKGHPRDEYVEPFPES
jgi:hypothetical protein